MRFFENGCRGVVVLVMEKGRVGALDLEMEKSKGVISSQVNIEKVEIHACKVLEFGRS